MIEEGATILSVVSLMMIGLLVTLVFRSLLRSIKIQKIKKHTENIVSLVQYGTMLFTPFDLNHNGVDYRI